MANDPPTALSMRFGYHQARASGLGGVRESRSPRQVNKFIEESQVARKLRAEVEKDTEWGPFVKHWIEDSRSADETFRALYRAQMYVWLKRKGYSLKYRLRWKP